MDANKTITLIGLKLGYKTTNKNEKAMEDCGALWQELDYTEWE